ncbi:MAG: cytochrome c oxidase subunit II [Acidimicrobiia bacterium]|jgi:cytochrome c oxidase subunit 2|nr:MAG: cytochrome c oxidase subunit II [Acidimicrobiia bacterium]
MLFGIDRYERIFLGLTIVILLFGVGAIAMSITEADIHLPDKVERIDPNAVRTTPPFDNPGVFEMDNGEYQVVMIGQTWRWEPDTIEVPRGSIVHFQITSPDILHGFHIWETAVNAMVIPGQVTEVTHTFNDAGEFGIVCHEYCGTGHHTMFGKVVVTP